ncbi:MAG: hypothetical protein RL477_1625 [Pseudomonadota bacterium]|jgi:hypothetical protein
MNAIRSAVVFAAVWAVAYVVSVELNLAAFTYHPRENLWVWGVSAPRNGPAMYYYGWLATAALAALGATVALQPLLRRIAVPLWLGWAVPLFCILSFLWFLRAFFWR